MRRWLFGLLCLLAQDTAPPALEVGSMVRETLGSSSERAETDAILAIAGDRIPTVAFQARILEAGSYHIDLVSHVFDAYLVVRDASGTLVAESNDGLVSTHARVVVELGAGDYRVDACALDRRTGAFELRLARGQPAELTDEERSQLELEDARAAVAALTDVDAGGSQLAGALQRLADRLSAFERHGEARAVLAELFELREASGKLLEAARVALSLARIDRELGSPAQARDEAARAVALLESERGADDPETAEARLLLGTLELDSGAGEQAVASFGRALFSLSKAKDEAAPLTIEALELLSTALGALGRYDEARRHDERFLPLLRESRESTASRAPAMRALLARLAVAARWQADLEAARTFLAELVESAEPGSADEAAARVDLAGVLVEQGHDRAATRELEVALTSFETALGDDAVETTDCAFSLARALASIGVDDRARSLFQEVLSRHEERSQHASAADVRHELGLLEARSGSESRALELLERARTDLAAALGSDHPRVLAVSLELCQLDPSSTVDELERIAEAAERALGADHALVGRTRVELGRNLARRGRSSEAQREIESGRVILASSLGAGHAESIAAVTSLARVRIDTGDVEGARQLLASDLAARAPVAWECFNHATERARFAALSAEREELELFVSLRFEGNAKASGEHEIAAYEAFARWRAHRASERFAGREAVAQRARGAGSLLAELGIVRTRIARRAEVPRAGARTAEAASAGARSAEAPNGPEGVPVAELHRRAREIEAELTRSFGSPPARLPYERLAWGLPPKSALVDFASLRAYRTGASGGGFDEPHLFAWVTRRSPTSFAQIDLGPSAEITALVERFVDALRARETARAHRDETAALVAARIWRPIAERLADELQVFTVLDPSIAALPLEALPAGDGALLIERMAFVQLTDASRLVDDGPPAVIPANGGGPEPLNALLAVGAVENGHGATRVLDASSDARSNASDGGEATSGVSRIDAAAPAIDLASPEGSGAELDLVSRIHAERIGRAGRRHSLRGAEASAARIANALAGQSSIHLSVGFADVPVAPLFDPTPSSAPSAPGALAPGRLAGLAVAGTEAGALLETRELGLLDLDGAQLVALTGGAIRPGDPRSGEEFLGLVRVLEAAGATSVVAARWRHAQEDLLPLLQAFYGELWTQHSRPSDALRRAQLAAIARARAADGDPHPERWAAWFATLARP